MRAHLVYLRFCSAVLITTTMLQLAVPSSARWAYAERSSFEARSQKALGIARELSKCKHNSQDQRQFLDQIKTGLTQAVATGDGTQGAAACSTESSKLSQFQSQIQKIQAAVNSQNAGKIDLKSAQSFSRALRNQVLRNAIVSHVDAAYRYPFANQTRKIDSTVQWFCGSACSEGEKNELKVLLNNYRDGFQKSKQRAFQSEAEAQAELNRKLGLINERHQEIFKSFNARKELEALDVRQRRGANQSRPVIDSMVDTRKSEMDFRGYFDRLDRAEKAELQAQYNITFYHYTQSDVGLLMYTEAFRNSKTLGEPGKLKAPNGLVSKGVHEVLRDTHALAQRTLRQHDVFVNTQSVAGSGLDPLLEAFKTNPVAAGQVLLEHPEWASLVCHLMVKIESNDQAKRNQGKALEVLAWGGMILGGVLIATGVLSAAGLALGAVSASAISTLTLVNIGVGLGSTALNTAYTVDRKNTLRVESIQIQQAKNAGTSSASITDQLLQQYGGELKSLPSNQQLVFQGVMAVLPFGVNKLAAPLARATTQWGTKSPTVAKLLDWAAMAKTNPKVAAGLDVLNFSCGALQVTECEQLLSAFQMLPLKRQQALLENPTSLKAFTDAHFAKVPVKSEPTLSPIANKVFSEFNLRLSRIGEFAVKNQGKTGTCAIHASCAYLELNGDLPKGKSLNIEQLDGSRVLERVRRSILENRVDPAPEAKIRNILSEGNYTDDVLNTIALKTPRLIDAHATPELPAMFQEKQRVALEKELTKLLADENLNRKEKLAQLDAIMTKYYGKFEFDRETHRKLSNKTYEVLSLSESSLSHINESNTFKTSTLPSYVAKVTEVDSNSSHLSLLENHEGLKKKIDAIASEGNQELIQKIISKPISRDEALAVGEAFYMDSDGVFKRIDVLGKIHLGYVANPMTPGSKPFVLKEDTQLFAVPNADLTSKKRSLLGTVTVPARRWVNTVNRSGSSENQIAEVIQNRLQQDKPVMINVSEFRYDRESGTLLPEKTPGAHAMVVVGAKQNEGKLDELLLLNSWGREAGNQGYYRVRWEDLVKSKSFHVIAETDALPASPQTPDAVEAPGEAMQPSTLSIQQLKQQARGAVEYLNPKYWIERYRESHAKTHREPTVEFDSYEHARNYVLNFKPLETMGFTLPNKLEWKRYSARMPQSKAKGQVTGWEQTLENGSHARIRLDYSPELGAHYNIEVRHLKDNGGFEHVKLAVPFKCGDQACDEREFEKIIRRMNH